MIDQKDHPIDQAVRRAQMLGVYLSLGLDIFIILSYLVYRRYISQDTSSFYSSLFLLLVILMLSIGWMTYRITKQVHLVTSPSGITMYSPGLELCSSWENVGKVGSMPALFGLRKYDSLVLRQPAEQKCAWWFRLLRGKPEKEIPLSMFGNWRESELGQEIKKYAPHLFG